MNLSDRTSRIGWLFYEESAMFREPSLRFWSKVLRPLGYEMASADRPWVKKHFPMPSKFKLYSLRLELLDGTLLQGPELFRHLFRQLWWTYPVYLIACTPLLKEVFDFICCRLFAMRDRGAAPKSDATPLETQFRFATEISTAELLR